MADKAKATVAGYVLSGTHSARIGELTDRSGKDEQGTNPRGIPYAPFVDRVEDYVATRADVEPTLRSFQEMISLVSPRTCLAKLASVKCAS